MTANLLARIILKVLGIYFLFQALVATYQLVLFLRMPSAGTWGPESAGAENLAVLLGVLHLAVVGSVGLACFVNTGFLARKLFPECQDQEVSVGGPDSGGLLFRVLAVGVLLYAIPGVLRGVFEILWYLGGERRHLLASVLEQNGPDHAFWLVVSILALLVYRNAERLARGGS